MSLEPKPLCDHGEGFFTWHAYDPSCKAELWSTAYITEKDTILFDPIDWPKNTPSPTGRVQIVKTNANHDRCCESLARSFRGRTSPTPLGFQIIALGGAGENETAYFHLETGTLVVGDALIHLYPNPIMPLPDKYCTDPSRLRQSLGNLAKLPIRRIFFAHGAPILQDGVREIRNLLS